MDQCLSAQPEPFLSLVPPQRIARRVLTLIFKVDECTPLSCRRLPTPEAVLGMVLEAAKLDVSIAELADFYLEKGGQVGAYTRPRFGAT